MPVPLWLQPTLGRILTPPPYPRPIPSPHDGEVGRGLGRGDSKERDNSMERAPLPLVPRREREQETSAMVGLSRCATVPPSADGIPCRSMQIRRRIPTSAWITAGA